MTKVLGVDVGAVRERVGGARAGDLSGGLGTAVGAVGDLGAFLREQREHAQMSLRQLAAAAGVSNPYLSQVERGLRRPSAEVLQQIARGLRISAEALYVRAGILEQRPGADGDVREALLSDPFLSERQRQVVLEIYSTFRTENARSEVPPPTGRPVSAPEDGTADEGPVEKASVEKAPVEKAPVDKAPVDKAPTSPRRRRRPAPTSAGTAPEAPSSSGDDASPETARRGSSTGRPAARSRRRGPAGPPSPRDVAREAALTVPEEPSPQAAAASHPADGTAADGRPTDDEQPTT